MGEFIIWCIVHTKHVSCPLIPQWHGCSTCWFTKSYIYILEHEDFYFLYNFANMSYVNTTSGIWCRLHEDICKYRIHFIQMFGNYHPVCLGYGRSLYTRDKLHYTYTYIYVCVCIKAKIHLNLHILYGFYKQPFLDFMYNVYFTHAVDKKQFHGALFLFHNGWSVECNYSSIPKLQWLYHWSLGIGKMFYPTLQFTCTGEIILIF